VASTAGTYAKSQVGRLDFRKMEETDRFEGRPALNSKPIKLAIDQVEKATRELIEDFFAWDNSHPDGERPPINRITELSPATLRKNAATNIRKAARVETGPKDKGWWQYIHTASHALASAWWIEWNADAAKREKARADKARAESERREHEASLRPNPKRISELQSIIREAEKGEELLASIYRAFELHKSAQHARKELQELKVKAENAALALDKKAPVLDVPKSAHVSAAEKLASIFYAAVRPH
jgi:hypothetical protein